MFNKLQHVQVLCHRQKYSVMVHVPFVKFGRVWLFQHFLVHFSMDFKNISQERGSRNEKRMSCVGISWMFKDFLIMLVLSLLKGWSNSHISQHDLASLIQDRYLKGYVLWLHVHLPSVHVIRGYYQRKTSFWVERVMPRCNQNCKNVVCLGFTFLVVVLCFNF